MISKAFNYSGIAFCISYFFRNIIMHLLSNTERLLKLKTMVRNNTVITFVLSSFIAASMVYSSPRRLSWESAFVKINKDSTLSYTPDTNGNIIPDFSNVGYYGGDKPIPAIPVVKTVVPTGTDNDQHAIQSAIDEVSKRIPDRNGF